MAGFWDSLNHITTIFAGFATTFRNHVSPATFRPGPLRSRPILAPAEPRRWQQPGANAAAPGLRGVLCPLGRHRSLGSGGTDVETWEVGKNGEQKTNLELKLKKVGILAHVGSRLTKNHQDVDPIKKYRKQSRKDRNKQKSGCSKTQSIKHLHSHVHACFKYIVVARLGETQMPLKTRRIDEHTLCISLPRCRRTPISTDCGIRTGTKSNS